ncbi:MAG TPA: N-carbamoylputrescine amidase [Spirochaetota bacterium]|nr:N-carbamoylputrescine amidase [Spirochaetota bacterium]
MRKVKVAATQMSCKDDIKSNIEKSTELVKKAAEDGANIILLQELFETQYFCQKEKPDFFNLATTLETNLAVNHFKNIARELNVVLPISFFEKKNRAYYNSVCLIDDKGEILGVYRKSHIPDGPGYEEKFYFSPGDTGFKVWQTRFGKIGVGICWDQWFPEAARVMALMGAEILFYPTAIGSEPQDKTMDSKDHWQIVMRGHSGANLIPVVASNRVGTEKIDDSEITFYGSSFITGINGELLREANRTDETILTATFDLDSLEKKRSSWGVFRDRRPDLYKNILTLDGIV